MAKRTRLQTERLSEQQVSIGGPVGIFGAQALQHDLSVGEVCQKVYQDLCERYQKYEFRHRTTLKKEEINAKLQQIDSRLGLTLFVQNSYIEPDGGIIEVLDRSGMWRVILVAEAKYQGKDIENIMQGKLVGTNKDQVFMVAGNAIERVFKNINEIRNFMLDELHFPYVVFLQGSNFATETFLVVNHKGENVEIRHDIGSLNRIDRVSAANYCMPINHNYCKNIFIGKKNSIMLQAASIYAKAYPWSSNEMYERLMNVAQTSMTVLNQLG